MEKNSNLFFADVLRKATLTETQEEALHEILFPPKDKSPRAKVRAGLDAQLAYERWSRQYEYEEAQKPKKPVAPKMMSQEEIDDLIRLETGDLL